MALERTLAIIKPDAVKNGHVGEIISTIEQNGFRILGLKLRKLTHTEAEDFYAVHKKRPFYEGLVTFMTEGPVIVIALEREDAISKWREVMGATDPAKASDGSIRKRFAESIERNCVHGSDQDIPFFFTTEIFLAE